MRVAGDIAGYSGRSEDSKTLAVVVWRAGVNRFLAGVWAAAWQSEIGQISHRIYSGWGARHSIRRSSFCPASRNRAKCRIQIRGNNSQNPQNRGFEDIEDRFLEIKICISVCELGYQIPRIWGFRSLAKHSQNPQIYPTLGGGAVAPRSDGGSPVIFQASTGRQGKAPLL
jgi:hypothetical protein